LELGNLTDQRRKGSMFGKRPFSLQRRKLFSRTLSVGLGSAAALGLADGAAPAQTFDPRQGQAYPESLSLAVLRDYRIAKSSSYDRTGGNADARKVDAGTSITVLDHKGPGTVGHIWFTINSQERWHLKKLLLRMYWDDEAEPSVEVPIGDFFGLNLGSYFTYQSAMLSVAPVKALNSYFPMPFRKSARITVTNEGSMPVRSLYWNIDYESLRSLPENLGYFHAQYRQAAPCPGWETAEKLNPTGKHNYVFMEAEGRGHLVGVSQGVLLNQDGWWGEGDDMLFIDGSPRPVTNGTGSEDYYNGAWGFDGQSFDYEFIGVPHVVNPYSIGGEWCLYRWHLDSLPVFQKSIRMTIEHGTGNDRSDNFYSVAYWYQTEPHLKFPALPPPDARVPKVFAVPKGAARLNPNGR
jgi:D-arabinan exo alpha-(1,3)/(1,5)-arabinofuranosidase (non-reducing end)